MVAKHISHPEKHNSSIREALEIHFQKQKVIIWSWVELQQLTVDSEMWAGGHIFMADLLIDLSNKDVRVDLSP